MLWKNSTNTSISNKQKAQRERFALKGFISATQSRAKGFSKSFYTLEIEQTRLAFIQDACTMLLKYFDGHTKEIIDRTKNV